MIENPFISKNLTESFVQICSAESGSYDKENASNLLGDSS